jgi:hypothetical protein
MRMKPSIFIFSILCCAQRILVTILKLIPRGGEGGGGLVEKQQLAKPLIACKQKLTRIKVLIRKLAGCFNKYFLPG